MILRIYTSTSAEQAEKYFIKAGTPELYYGEGQEFTGYWGGKAAAMMGLSGRVDGPAFSRLCHNLDPATGDQLTPRMKSDRRPGFDFNFNVPKSVSLAYAWTKDERILRAFRQAVFDTMQDIEEMAATRVRSGGRDEDRTTGKLVWAEYVHLTARPENGVPDPHLHIHCYVLNVTYDAVEKKWKAAQMGNIWDEADNFDKVVMKRLMENLKAIGLDIVLTKDAFEIAGISQELRDEFSNRTLSINAYAAAHGITDPAAKAKLAALTRENKAKTLLLSELEEIWWNRLSPEHKEALEAVKAALQRSKAMGMAMEMVGEPLAAGRRAGASSKVLGTREQVKGAGANGRISLNKKTRPVEPGTRVVVPTENEWRAVTLATEHILERQSAATEIQLIGEASQNWCVGETTVAGIKQAVAETPFIRRDWKGKKMLTTERVLAEEKRLVNRCIEGKGQCEALNPYWQIENTMLNEQQRNAVTHVLQSTDLISGIKGRAGVGKTTLLEEVRRGIQSGMNKLLALAPTSEAAHDVLRQAGFQNAETVAKLLSSEALQREAQGAVLLVDEAGLLSNREADRLFALAARINARLVLVGDIGQHHPVERGQAFDLLEKNGNMATAEVTEIQRQKGNYKRFVELLLEGDTAGAIGVAKEMNSVFEMSLEERKIALAKEYVAALERGETAAVVAPTHAECNDVTEGIRQVLKEAGTLKEGTQWDTLRNLSWTEAQMSDPDKYKRGMIAQINGHVKGFALGEQVEVIGVRDGMVRVRSDDGFHSRIKALPLSEPSKFDIYERDTLEVCEGDRLRITGNGRTADGHRLSNRTVHTVDYIDRDGKIVLENGWRLDRNFKHLDHGYASTSHAAQGKTVDWVFVAESAQLSAGASDAQQFYVSTTRGRKGMKLYTEDLELLIENVSRVRERPMATEIVQGERQVEMVEEIEPVRSAGFLGKSAAVNAEGMEILAATAEQVREQAAAAAKTEAEVQAAEWSGTQQQMATLEDWTPETKVAKPPAKEPEMEVAPPEPELEMEMEM